MLKRTISRVAYSFVMADLLHYGHLRLLKTAKEQADYHICGLISDEACHIWQGMNISNYDERKGVLESLDCVDEIIKQETMDPTENLKAVHRRFPKATLVLVHGDDWKALPASEYIRQIGGSIIQPEYYSRLSRQNIVKKFAESWQEAGAENSHTLAVILPEEPDHNLPLKFIIAVSIKQGLNIKYFSSAAEAQAWLSGDGSGSFAG